MFCSTVHRTGTIAFAACVILAATACQSPKPLEKRQFRATTEQLSLADVRTISLSKEGSAITFPSGFLAQKDHFLLMDPLSSMRCFVFNADGSLKFELGRTGQGPGEYQLPMSFTESEGRYYLVSGGDRRINVYDKNGSFSATAR